MQKLRRALLLIFVPTMALVGCSPDLPDSSETISANAQHAPYPSLVPLGPLLARVDEGSTIVDESAALRARVARLRARAAALKGYSIYDGQDRLRRLR